MKSLATLFLVITALAPTHAQPQEASTPGVTAPPELKAELAEHVHFKTVKWTHHQDHESFDLYVQDPPLANEFYVPKLSKLYGPWIDSLTQIFETEYVVPGKLTRRPTAGENSVPSLSLMILASQGDYINYVKRAKIYDQFTESCVYDPELGLVVTFEDATENLPVHVKRSRVLHGVVHALLHRYSDSSRPEGLPVQGSLWFHEGLAEYLSHHVARKPEDLSDRPMNAMYTRFLYDLYESPKERRTYVPRLGFLLSAKDLLEITAPAERVAKKEGLEYNWWSHARGFYSTCISLVHFLHRGQGGLYRERSVRYLAEILSGKDGKLAFQEVFEGVTYDTIEGKLPNYLYASLGGTPGPAVAPAALASAEDTPAPPDLSLLELRPEEHDERLSAAVEQAMSGDFAAALKRLEELAGEIDQDGRFAKRVAVEQHRMTSFRDLRDAYFAHLVASGDRFSIEHGGERLRATIRAVENGEALFEKPTRGVDRLLLKDLDAVALSQAIGSKGTDLAEDWVRYYPYCATVHEKWQRLSSRIEGPEIEALRGHAESDYPSLIARGRAARGLADLVAAGIPDTAQAATSTLEAIESLVTTFGVFPLIQSRKPALSRLARASLEIQFDALPLKELLSASVEDLGEERVKLTYEFENPEEARDWIEEEPLPLDFRKRFRPLADADPKKPFSFGEKGLRGLGARAIQHVLEFEPPLRYMVSATWIEDPRLAQTEWHLLLGASLDPAGSYAYWNALNNLTVYDPTARDYARHVVEGGPSLYLNQNYFAELIIDESGTAKGLIDGVEQATVPAHGCKRGKLFLLVHTDLAIVIHKIEIEGRVSKEGKQAFRKQWVAEALEGLGLEP